MNARVSMSHARQGFTLLELLVVILIMLMLTALAIPVIAPALANRQQREAARAINAFIGGARERAIALGRPVGVKLERFGRRNPSNPNQIGGQPDICTTLSYVEVPPPYAGETMNAHLAVAILNLLPNYPTADLATVYLKAFEQPVDAGGFDFTQARWFDNLQLDYRGPRYRIIGPTDSADLNQADPYQNDGIIKGLPLILETTVPMSTVVPLSGTEYTTRALPFLDSRASGYNDAMASRHAYRVVDRLPVRSTGEPLELPEGTVIDLNFSGLDWLPFYPRRSNSFSDPHHDDPAANGNQNNPVPVADTAPILIMFSPTGGLHRMWLCGDHQDRTRFPDGIISPYNPHSQIYLLVGKRELVRSVLYQLDSDLPTDAVHFNWQDLSSIWVTINHRTGLVTSVENSVADPWPPTDSNDTSPVTRRLGQARRLAVEAQSMGGR